MRKIFLTMALIISITGLTITGCTNATKYTKNKSVSSSGHPSVSENSKSSTTSNAPLKGKISMTAQDIDNISAVVFGQTIKAGEPVSDLLKAGFTIDNNYKNATIDSSHYTSIAVDKGNKILSLSVTATENTATPVSKAVICGFTVDSSLDGEVKLNNGLVIGMPIDEYKAHVQLPSDSSSTVSDSRSTSYKYVGTDKNNTDLTVMFIDGKLSAFYYSNVR